MIGHQQILQFFNTAIDNGTLSHAYLLVGPQHVGKRALADTIAAQLLETTPEKLSIHADVRIVQRERNEKTGKLKKDIGIDQIRRIRSFASDGPLTATHSILIIDEADLLNKSAANGLLKTLEEPHAKTVIFLTVRDPSRVPETIVSRAQSLYLHPVSDEAIQAYLAEQGAPQVADIVRIAAGLPGKAVTCAADAEALQTYLAKETEFTAMFGKPLFEKRNSVSYLFDKKEDHIAGRREIIDTLDIWKMTLHTLAKTGESTMSSSQAAELYDILSEAQGMLKQNIHPRAALDAVLLHIP